MSGISAIGGAYGSLSLTDLLSDAQQENDPILATSTTAASAQRMQSQTATAGSRARNAYGISATSGIGQAALKKALSEMDNNGGRVTFQDIAAYRQELENSFSSGLRVELYEKGVSLDTEFTLNMNSEGTIRVVCDDPAARETIQQYLADNSEICEEFGYIQALANLERARQGSAGLSAALGNVAQSKKEIQLAAVEAFFDEALSSGVGYSALMASFSSIATGEDAADSTSFYAGIDYTV